MATQFPDDFKCPISLEIMSDPVILSSGHTFDRSSIQRWLDSGNRTCPITKQPLPYHFSLIPNHALRSLISNFTLLQSSASAPKPPSQPPQTTHQTLIPTLTSPSSPPHLKLDSLIQLTRLSKRGGPLFRQRLMDSGAASAVLSCAAASPRLREAALALLLNLSLDDDSKVGLVAEGAISVLVDSLLCMDHCNCNSRAYAATVLTSLAMLDVNKGTIGAHPCAISVLVSLLSGGNERERREAATALFVLCSFDDNKKRAVECGAVGVLVELGGVGVERALGVLSLLGKCREGREEMGRNVGCVVGVLVGVLRGGKSARSVVYALSLLNSLCCGGGGGERFGVEVMRHGGLEICLALVEDENDKISRNASALVQSLRSCRLRG
ncbi:hypothetical protein Syun_010376 [Stephania yunnanensis]|uniref:RING-type E3 ubiquitin transferase n=1 Tax=Stephania yunnanensis TaxID=152371 RepID=A0AAP0KGD9_9MAGN